MEILRRPLTIMMATVNRDVTSIKILCMMFTRALVDLFSCLYISCIKNIFRVFFVFSLCIYYRAGPKPQIWYPEQIQISGTFQYLYPAGYRYR